MNKSIDFQICEMYTIVQEGKTYEKPNPPNNTVGKNKYDFLSLLQLHNSTKPIQKQEKIYEKRWKNVLHN